jgi:hypothetical protein
LKKIFLFSLLIILQIAISQAQLTQTIKGVVIDKDSKAPICGAYVMLENTDPLMGALSDNDGIFRIEKVPLGRYSVKSGYIGYETVTIPEVLVSSGKEIYLTIELKEVLTHLKEVTIVGNNTKGKTGNEMSVVSSRSFSVEEASRFSGNMNDISRIAQSYAGVSAGDLQNNLVIRGNSSKGMLWRLEGIEVPNLNHLANNGSSGGGLSLLSVNVLKNSDFYTGAFPAEFGNALSGVFDVNLRDGNNEKREYAIQAGFIGLEAEMEGPFSKKSRSSYMANYRYSTTGLLEVMGLKLTGGNMPEFHDLTVKLNFPTTKYGNFSFFALSGKSSVSNSADKDSAKWTSVDDRFQFVELSNVLATGLIHKYFFGNNTFLKSYISYSGNEIGEKRDSLDDHYELQPTFQSSFRENSIKVSTNLNHKFNSKNTIRTGIILSSIAFNFKAEDISKQEIYNDNKGDTWFGQYYAEWQHRFNEKLTLNSGVHALYFGLNSTYSIEPRLGFEWKINAREAIGFGYGIHSKIEPLLFYFGQLRQADGSLAEPNKKLRSTKAAHYVLSYDNLLAENLRLKIEAYYQNLYDVPVEDSAGSGFSVLNYGTGFGINMDNNADVALVNKGSGTNYGLELTLEKFFSKNYYFLFTASLYESKYKALDGIERNTRYNNNFITNFIAGKEFLIGKTKTNAIITDAKIIWAGGNRLSPINFEESARLGTTVYYLEQRYSEKAIDYFKINFKIGYRKNTKNTSYSIFLDVQNLTNRKNVFLQYYEPATNKVVTFYQLGLLPILNFRIQF